MSKVKELDVDDYPIGRRDGFIPFTEESLGNVLKDILVHVDKGDVLFIKPTHCVWNKPAEKNHEKEKSNS